MKIKRIFQALAILAAMALLAALGFMAWIGTYVGGMH